MKVDVRSELLADPHDVERVHELAFGSPDLARLVRTIRASAGYRADRSLVATIDRQIIGHVLLNPVGLQDDTGIVRPATVIAPLGVLPQWHRKGVGTALMEEAMARLEQVNAPIVILRGDLQYYSRFGFVPAIRHRIRPPFPIDENQYLSKPLTYYRPEYAGTVRYPQPFATVGYPVEWAYPETRA
jgi:putative acetyltransferase